MPIRITKEPPPIEDVAQRLAARITRDDIRPAPPPQAVITGNEERRQRSYRHCHLPAEPKPLALCHATPALMCRS